jgi:hypothetical protein
MSTPKFMPGPWVAARGMDWIVKAPDGRHFNVGDVLYHPENEANVRLIAAAPDLYAACKALVEAREAFDRGEDIDEQGEKVIAIARAALAAADGEDA